MLAGSFLDGGETDGNETYCRASNRISEGDSSSADVSESTDLVFVS